jgi:RHS repeat-associated protein
VLNLPVTKILYTGQMFDPNLEQYYLRARYYGPATARFTQQDTFAGSLTVPPTLHRYLYGGDNPIAFSDPSGQDWSAGEILTTIGIGLNVISFGVHVSSGARKLYNGDTKGAAQDFVWALVDLVFLAIPGSGPTLRASGLAVELVGDVEGLMQMGMQASAIYGWISTTLIVAQNAPGGGGDGGGAEVAVERQLIIRSPGNGYRKIRRIGPQLRGDTKRRLQGDPARLTGSCRTVNRWSTMAGTEPSS